MSEDQPKPRFEPLPGFREYPEQEMVARAEGFAKEMRRRRSVREFSPRPVPAKVIRSCLDAAGSAPSGANKQPWHFSVVRDPALKRRIREAAEEEERRFYHERAPEDWLRALAPLGTDEHKAFLESAPILIAIFAQLHGLDAQGDVIKHYYVNESVGIATGLLIACLHHAGLACLTHTPSPMRFLNEILDRPTYERPYLLLVVGYPDPGAQVPVIGKKGIDEYVSYR